MKKSVSKLALMGLALSACTGSVGDTPDAQGEGTAIDGVNQSIIGGTPANSPRLNGVGTLGMETTYVDDWTGETVTEYFPFCTASLIAPDTIVTAKHCVLDIPYVYESGGKVVFGIGPDGHNPIEKVEVVQVEHAPLSQPGVGIVELGHDVSVVHLERGVEGVTPLLVGELTQSAVGSRFGAIGYGVKDVFSNAGPRLLGNVTLNAIEGKWFELMFENFDGFVAWVKSMGGYPYAYPPTPVDENGNEIFPEGDITDEAWYRDWLQTIYDDTTLIAGYEADTGRGARDVQPCRGDSGGPLVKTNAEGKMVTYGVVSGAIHGATSPCDKGSVYASFGAETMPFLAAAQNWDDPCDGISAAGVCDGDVVTRCTTFSEGDRRLVEADCSLFGETCGVTFSGQAVCATPGQAPVDPSGSDVGPLTQTQAVELSETVLQRIEARARRVEQ